jgi:AmiR/NasT family two-component response regulator
VVKARLRIAVADDEPDMQQYFEKILPRLGHQVVSVSATGRELVNQCLAHRPDLVITDIKMPEMDGIEAAVELYRELAIPIILVSAYHDADLIARAEADHVMAYLVKPIKQADLEPAVALAMRRFHQFEAVQKEAADLRQALEDRKITERAKGILMKRAEIDEKSAFERLQKLSSECNEKMVEVARKIVFAEEATKP